MPYYCLAMYLIITISKWIKLRSRFIYQATKPKAYYYIFYMKIGHNQKEVQVMKN